MSFSLRREGKLALGGALHLLTFSTISYPHLGICPLKLQDILCELSLIKAHRNSSQSSQKLLIQQSLYKQKKLEVLL